MIKKNNLFFNIFIYSALFLIFIPLIVLVILAFNKRWPWPFILPTEYSFGSLTYILNGKDNSIMILLYSLTLSTAVTFAALLISIPAARALGLYEFKGKNLFKMLVLSPLLISPVAIGLGVQIFFIKIGIANSIIGVIIIHLIPCLPYSIRILTDVFEAVGEAYELQARTLGADKFKTFIYITLPMMSPGLITSGTLVFIVSMSQYFLTFIIGGGKVITFTMLMFPFIQSGDRMIASIYSVVFIFSSLILLLLMEKAIKNHYKIENYFYL